MVVLQVAMPLAHDVEENARPKTDEFIENVMRPAVEDLIKTLEVQADEMSKKVSCPSQRNAYETAMCLIWCCTLLLF